MPVIETRGLSRRFDEYWAVDDVDLSVEPGEVLALLGPNGAGKTTTVRLLNGVLAATRGQARVLGFDPTDDGDRLRLHTGVLTEHAGLDDRLTARENLAFAARARGLDGTDADGRIADLLEQFDMIELADERTHGFSTGQRKRIAIIRALLHDPELLFLDEPTSGLDPAAGREVIDLIERLARQQGRTVVLCTHFLGEAGHLADRMAYLHRGRLRAFGRPRDLAHALWNGLDVTLDLGRPAGADTLAVLASVAGVGERRATDEGAWAHIDDRHVVPRLVRTLVTAGCEVYGVSADQPDLEDVYFALEAKVTHDPEFRMIDPPPAGERVVLT